MLSIKKRGRVYRLEGKISNEYIRLTLGTRNEEAALKCKNKIENAICEGKGSARWPELRGLLPTCAFERLAAVVGYVETPAPPPPATWADLERSFSSYAMQRINIGKLCATTLERYQQTLKTFGAFLAEEGLRDLVQITKPVVERYKGWRMNKLREDDHGGKSLPLDVAILHRVFSFAVECEMVERNPVRLEGRPGDSPERGAQPFTGEQLGRLRAEAGPDLLTFLVLRHTGLRGSDVVGLRWEAIDWELKEITHLTQKRRKKVVLPLHTELLFALEIERDKRQPSLQDRVLLNPVTGKPLTRPRLYERMLALGQRAKVAGSNPHRFRDTLAVDLLLKGASPYNVAKLLSDTIDTVERHYAPFVRELRERARRIMESTEGLENPKNHCTLFAHSAENDESKIPTI